MPNPDVAIIVNPERSDAADELLEVLGRENGDGSAAPQRQLDVVRPESPDGLAEAVAEAAGRAGVVAVVGGDGSQRTAASVLSQSAVALAVVPGGTVNLLARVLGIDSVATAADAIDHGERRTIDLGVVEGETFVLNASSGYDADVIGGVDDAAKRWGRMGYLKVGVQQLRTTRPRHVTVTVDGAEWYRGRAVSVIVTNVGQRGSADFTLAQGSAPDDGKLDVVVQRCDTVPTMLRAGWALLRSRPPRPEDLRTTHGAVVDVHWEVVMMSQRDGDATGDGMSFHHEVVPNALTVCVPATTG